VRRSAPRPLSAALAEATGAAAPTTLLARTQSCWPEVAGATIAAEAEPVAERGGVLTVACRSAVWAHELELLGEDLLARLNEALDGGGGRPLEGLSFRTGKPASGGS
jgi:predicted nucleic acid-binding Zn ribbon protein